MTQVHFQFVALAIKTVLRSIAIGQSPVEVDELKHVTGVQGASEQNWGLVKVEDVLDWKASNVCVRLSSFKEAFVDSYLSNRCFQWSHSKVGPRC